MGHGFRSIPALLLAAIALSTVGLFGCASAGDSPPAETTESLTSTVREYNRLLTEGFRELDMAVLEPVATLEQAEREWVYMTALGEGRMRLESTLTAIEFVEVSADRSSAIVDTVETWDYAHIDIDTGETMTQESGVEYRLRYLLVNERGRWFVSEVISLDESGGDAGIPGEAEIPGGAESTATGDPGEAP